MADREFSWQKENPASDPNALAKIQADIDARNQAKWKAAREYCADRMWEFKVITEKELDI